MKRKIMKLHDIYKKKYGLKTKSFITHHHHNTKEVQEIRTNTTLKNSNNQLALHSRRQDLCDNLFRKIISA